MKKLMHDIIPRKLSDAILAHKLIAVLVIEEEESVRPLLYALSKAGLNIIELTLRTPVALKAIEIVKKEFPEIILGAGTVLRESQLREVHALGVDFAVAPGLNEHVIDLALELSLPFFPGVMSPTEIERAISYGCNILKFFPAGAMGGLSYLKAANAPYSHLGLKYIPLGGVSPENLVEYTSSSIVAAVGGSWLAPPKLIKEKQWTTITDNATKALSLIKNI